MGNVSVQVLSIRIYAVLIGPLATKRERSTRQSSGSPLTIKINHGCTQDTGKSRFWEIGLLGGAGEVRRSWDLLGARRGRPDILGEVNQTPNQPQTEVSWARLFKALSLLLAHAPTRSVTRGSVSFTLKSNRYGVDESYRNPEGLQIIPCHPGNTMLLARGLPCCDNNGINDLKTQRKVCKNI